MKETINEHDMTKKMMSIMRGGYKPLLKEEDSSLNVTQTEPDINKTQKTAKPPREGRAPLIQLDGSYFEMDKNDSRFKALEKSLIDRVEQAEVTSVYISDPKGLVINGVALDFSENSGLYFTLALSEDSVLISSENVQGKLSTEVQTNLQTFLALASLSNCSLYSYCLVFILLALKPSRNVCKFV